MKDKQIASTNDNSAGKKTDGNKHTNSTSNLLD